MKHNVFRKIGAFLAVFCMLITLLPVTAYANPESVTENQSAIPADAILLSKPADVLDLAEKCRVNTWSVGKTVVLENDIDMSDIEFDGIPTFGGTFLGQGHKITWLNMVKDGSVVGLFRYLQKTAIVDALHVEGVFQPKGSKSTVGAIAGSNAGIIHNCTANVLVSGYEQIGGIVGVNEVSGVISECKVEGTVYGSHFVGGIVGENHGVVRNCTNQSVVNTQSVQNSVSIEDITIESMLNTESANTTTDIGGIAGISSGVIRGCFNEGNIGYQSMGYNVGGIVGTQNGFVVDCKNEADVQGRKEVGGIVGHMEPNIAVNFSTDSLQELSAQLKGLGETADQLKGSVENSESKLNDQVNRLEQDIAHVQGAIDELEDAATPDLDLPERGEDFQWKEEIEHTTDRITAASNDLANSIENVYKDSENLQKESVNSAKDISKQIKALTNKLDEVEKTISTMEEGINLEMKDISDADTEEDTIGKISNCINSGNISGDMNIGGIAGIMAEENDLDDYQDTSVYGDVSVNISSEIRIVIRGCQNLGKVSAGKQNAGGITGYMMLGAILESINLGNLDSLNADYIGGIAGNSSAIIRNCSSKCIIAGDDYVGGVAGKGETVTGCYAFIQMDAYKEKSGAILGEASELPDGEEDIVAGNYFFITDNRIGGIDGITYSNATNAVDLSGFLQLPNLNEALKMVNIRFVADGQDDIIIKVNVGDNLGMDKLPILTVEEGNEYDWEYIPAVTAKTLQMGETAAKIFISEELLTNILFDQTYQAVYDRKNTVISGTKRNSQNLSIILAEGSFAKHTTLDITDLLTDGASIAANGENVFECWKVEISNPGVTKLHYLIPEGQKASALMLYVQDASGKWLEREFTVEGSYLIFDFADGEMGFALQKKEIKMEWTLLAVFGIGVLIGIIGGKTRSKKKKNKKEEEA